MNKEQVFDVYDHETGETFQIVSLEMFIKWLNDIDNIFTFKVRENENA